MAAKFGCSFCVILIKYFKVILSGNSSDSSENSESIGEYSK